MNTIDFGLDDYPIFFDIAELFMANGVLYSSDQVEINGQMRKVLISGESVTLLEKYYDFFTLLSLQDAKLVNTNQYLIACSIISASRKHCGLNPIWTDELV